MTSKTGRRGFAEYVASLLRSSVLSSRGWPEWLGGILLGMINILFFAWAKKPFSVYTGFLNWGQHIYADLIGIKSFGIPSESLLFNKTSVGDIGLFMGALLAALAAGEFKLRLPARAIDYAEGVLGGVLMALGVVLAVGCNWGGFFSAITALSLHGYLMFLGLLAGGFLGALYVEWRAKKEAEEVELEIEELEPAPIKKHSGPTAAWLVAAILPIAVLWKLWTSPGGGFYAVILLMGMAVGVVLQRSRFCFATAFRDILRGGGEFRRSVRLQVGIALGILLGATGAAILKYMGYVDPMAYVKPAGWSNVLGGLLFGLGMVIAGGCASGSLWRAAEGHVKLWVALAAAVLSYAPLKHLVKSYAPWIYGEKILLVSELGWVGGLALIYTTMILWILFVLYLDYRRWEKHG